MKMKMQRRYLSLLSSSSKKVKQVSKSNFTEALDEIKDRINGSDFIAVSLQKTGHSFAPWSRILPFDTPETAYLKAKDAAQRFELFQFAVCPFKIQGHKILAFPYNFHLFPRDELNIGMPSYSFSCQTSCLTSMAREGFDFNICIYDGLTYLSRVQESTAKCRIGTSIPSICQITSSSSPSVADSIFMERIKSQVRHWRDACKSSSNTADEVLVNSIRKIILGSDVYGSRPCMNVDVCNESQVQLVVKMLSEFSDDLVPIVIPDKGGGPKAVRIVLTSSEEDKFLLMSELCNLEEEQGKQVRGFREVIDAISSSHKTVVAYNCLTDFSFIHSKFLAPLPPSMAEFMCSLRMVFSNVVDVGHLLKEINPLKKANSIPAALSYLKRQFFVPLEMEVPDQASEENGGKNSGHNVLRVALLFAKLSYILKITHETAVVQGTRAMEDFADAFYPCFASSVNDSMDDNAIEEKMDTVKILRTDKIIFLWGFCSGISAGVLKSLLHGIHDAFSEDFEVRLVDKSCAAVVCWRPGSVEALLKDMTSGAECVSGALREMMSEGLKATGYHTYDRVCRLGLWEATLADSLDKVLTEPTPDPSISYTMGSSEIYWSSDSIIKLEEL